MCAWGLRMLDGYDRRDPKSEWIPTTFCERRGMGTARGVSYGDEGEGVQYEGVQLDKQEDRHWQTLRGNDRPSSLHTRRVTRDEWSRGIRESYLERHNLHIRILIFNPFLNQLDWIFRRHFLWFDSICDIEPACEVFGSIREIFTGTLFYLINMTISYVMMYESGMRARRRRDSRTRMT